MEISQRIPARLSSRVRPTNCQPLDSPVRWTGCMSTPWDSSPAGKSLACESVTWWCMPGISLERWACLKVLDPLLVTESIAVVLGCR